MWTARAQRRRRPDAKEGIENHKRTTIASRLESGTNVLCGRREHSGGGGGQRLQKGIKHSEHKERVST